MDPTEGMFVLFSAGQGQSALDRLSDNDADPNSVFTRTLLAKMGGSRPVDGADRQEDAEPKCARLLAKVDHVQVPAYYDQIVAISISCRRCRGRRGGKRQPR